jgi:hypothetical protein
MKDGYGSSDAGMKKGSGGSKDAGAYSEKAGQGAGAARKGAKLDSQGQVGKKDESQYKAACKDE